MQVSVFTRVALKASWTWNTSGCMFRGRERVWVEPRLLSQPGPHSPLLCLAHHASFNETFQFLFWTMFGMEEHSVVDMPQFLVPEFVGRAMYGIFTIVMVIVLLNMLIAMITNSFQKIEV